MRRIRRRFCRSVFNSLSRRFRPRFRNTHRPRLTNASRVRDGLRIHLLRSESPRALIARILIGGILADTNRFFNDQISLQNSNCNVGDRLPTGLGANIDTNRLRDGLRFGGPARTGASPHRNGENAPTASERSADVAGKGEHHRQSIAAKRRNAFGSICTCTYASAWRECSTSISNDG